MKKYFVAKNNNLFDNHSFPITVALFNVNVEAYLGRNDLDRKRIEFRLVICFIR